MGKVILVAAAAYNWAECHRMAGIGKEFLKLGYTVFSLGTGKYDYLLKDKMNHLTIAYDTFWYTSDRISKLMNMDEYGNNYCQQEELENMLSCEKRLLEEIKPDLVVTGYRTTLTLSCKMVDVPLVWILSAVVSPLYYQYGLATMPDRAPIKYINRLDDEKLQSKYYCKMALKNNSTSKVWNKVANKYNIPTLKSDLEIYNGNLLLMSDVPELFPDFVKLPKHYLFCGPLFNYEKISMPSCMKRYKEKVGRKKIFVTMGSSGETQIMLKILDSLTKVEADIFVATTSIIDLSKKEYPDNFYFADKYPHKRIAEWVDLSIIHGGQGTVYTTLVAGKPFIGIPMFSEQQYNIENAVRFGSGEYISVKELFDGALEETIYKIFNNDMYNDHAKKLKKIVMPYYNNPEKNGSSIAVKRIKEFFWNEY